MGNACRAYGKMRNAYKILVVDFGWEVLKEETTRKT
jgi:hypothetical protein